MFDAADAWLEVPISKSLQFGTDDFSIGAWIHTDKKLDDVMTYYVAKMRIGFTISLMNYTGITNSQSNSRNVLFGIDAGHVDKEWTDC